MPDAPSDHGPARTREEVLLPPLAPYECEAWVIPNGHGQLWTPHVFDTKEEADAYQHRFWRGTGSTHHHQPKLAIVTVIARLYPETCQPGANP